MAKVIKTTFMVRRGQSKVWASIDPKLAAGEPGYELDTHRLKIGDGEKTWNKLPYIGEGAAIPEMQDYVTKDELEELVRSFVKSSDEINQVKILNDGTMEVNQISLDKLYQADGAVLILDGSV